MTTVRWWLLAEDKQHERFALALAPRLRLKDRPIQVFVAPSGRGAGSAWVRQNYARLARTTVRKRPGERVALIVMVDGDNVGVQRRKGELDAALRDASEPSRSAHEPIVILVPTWSIETWLLMPPASTELQSFKEQLREPTHAHLEQAVTRLLQPSIDELASLRDGHGELRRIAAS